MRFFVTDYPQLCPVYWNRNKYQLKLLSTVHTHVLLIHDLKKAYQITVAYV